MPSLLPWLKQFALPSVMSILATYIALRWLYRHELRDEIARNVEVPSLSSGGRYTAYGLGVTAIALLLASAFDIQLGAPTFAAGAATALFVLVLNREAPWPLLGGVSWSVLPLVAGLFVLVAGINKTGAVAQGFALASGHTTADALTRFAKAAAHSGATSVRPTPGRSLLAIGLSRAAAPNLRKAAAAEGFVVDPDDARRHVVACAGKPACGSAKLSTRQLAPDVARAAELLAGTSEIVHLSGCSKGCAHPGRAALTIVGPNHVIINGRAGDNPTTTIATAACGVEAATAALLTTVQNFCAEFRHV